MPPPPERLSEGALRRPLMLVAVLSMVSVALLIVRAVAPDELPVPLSGNPPPSTFTARSSAW